MVLYGLSGLFHVPDALLAARIGAGAIRRGGWPQQARRTQKRKARRSLISPGRAKTRPEKWVRGDIRAPSESAANAALRRQGINVTKLKKQKVASGKVSDKDITLFSRQLATMVKSGVPLLQSFDIVGKGTNNPALAKLLFDIKADVETGSNLATAFRKYPLYFDALFCNLVEAGEQAGILDSLLDRLATYKEKTQAIKAKIKGALFYPVSIIVVAFIITAVIMIFVVPAFKSVFASFGGDLPAPTLIVVAISDGFVANWHIIFGGMYAVIYGIAQAYKRSRALQIAVDKYSLKLPVFGDLLVKSSIARWTRTLSTMFAAGVPLVEALDSVGGAAELRLHARYPPNQERSFHRLESDQRDGGVGAFPDDGDPDGRHW
jgi:type IV pilus assembly protein PilC